jgi:hypothetical protein
LKKPPLSAEEAPVVEAAPVAEEAAPAADADLLGDLFAEEARRSRRPGRRSRRSRGRTAPVAAEEAPAEDLSADFTAGAADESGREPQ